MKFFLFLLILNVLDVIAVISARFYIETNKNHFRIITMAFFGMSAYVFTILLNYKVTAIVNILWVSISTIIITILCHFLFKEQIKINQLIGIILIIIGLSIL